MDPEYLNTLIELAQNRFNYQKERVMSIDQSRVKIGRTSSFSAFDKYSYDSTRKAHLDSIVEGRIN
jgi:hypothetical protein